MEEDGDIFASFVVDELVRSVSVYGLSSGVLSTYIAGLEVESRGIECIRLGKICHAHSEMTEFVHRCWS